MIKVNELEVEWLKCSYINLKNQTFMLGYVKEGNGKKSLSKTDQISGWLLGCVKYLTVYVA